MIIFKQVADIKTYIARQKEVGKKVSFVPTMGALHEGHLTLIQASQSIADITVCSIFVNPTQFNDINDFNKYPVTIDNDILLLEEKECDILFLPSVTEMYPHGTHLDTPFALGQIEEILEGSFRPGHFQGVCQVVNRLLEIVQPDILTMGQKDYQQIKVIEKMLSITGSSVQLKMNPIVRAENGLALSSRNVRLSDTDKKNALVLSSTLRTIQQRILAGDKITSVTEDASQHILAYGFEKIDYVAITDRLELNPVLEWDGSTPLVALVAAWIDGVRLIDNMEI